MPLRSVRDMFVFVALLSFFDRFFIAVLFSFFAQFSHTFFSVDTDVWRHVAITWGRVNRKVRLYVNGDVKLDQFILDYPVLDFKNSGHSVYDIGLKRGSATTTHAYFSDLVIFTHELSGAEVKYELFANHPLRSFI